MTGCIIYFCANFTDVIAKVYRSYDVSAEYTTADLKRFFEDVKKECNRDKRFNDPSYLAAKFVVWQQRFEDVYKDYGIIINDLPVHHHVFVICDNTVMPQILYKL